MVLFLVVIAALATTLAAPIPERSVLDFPVASILRPTPSAPPAPDEPIATGRPLSEVFQVHDEGFDSGLLSMLARDGPLDVLNRTLAEIFAGTFDGLPPPPPSGDDEPQTNQEIGIRDIAGELIALNRTLAENFGGDAPPAAPSTPEQAPTLPSGAPAAIPSTPEQPPALPSSGPGYWPPSPSSSGPGNWAPTSSGYHAPAQTSQAVGGNGNVQETGPASEQEIGQGNGGVQEYGEVAGNDYSEVPGNDYAEVPGNEDLKDLLNEVKGAWL